MQVVVGAEIGEGLIDGDVPPRRRQRVLEPVALGRVVEDVVGGDQWSAGLAGQGGQLAVAAGVAGEEVALDLDEHRVRAEPLPVPAEQVRGLLPAAVERQVGERAVAAAGQQDHAAGMFGQAGGVEPGLPPVGGVGQGEEPGDVGVAPPRLGQQDEAGAVGECQLGSGDRLDAEAVGEAGELQRPAEVGVGEGQGVIAVLARLGQQLVGVRRAHAEGVEARGVQLDVTGGHARWPGPRRSAGTSGARRGRGRA